MTSSVPRASGSPKKSKRPSPKPIPGVLSQAGVIGQPELLPPDFDTAKYRLRLYVSGSTLKSARAVANIKRISEEYLKNRYELEVIDVYQQPDLARVDQIVAVPTLIRCAPLPARKLFGDLSNTATVLLGLGLEEHHQK